MEQQKIILITLLVVLTLGLVALLVIFLTPLTYDQVLAQSLSKINRADNVSINYEVTLTGRYNGQSLNQETISSYVKSGDQVSWTQNLTIGSDNLYNTPPEELISLMQQNISSQGYLATMDKINNCYILRDEIYGDPTGHLLNNYDRTIIIACLNKSNGYPAYYSIAAIGLNNIIITYET